MPNEYMPALHKLEAVDAFRLAIEQSGKTPHEVAIALGWSDHFARRVFSAEKFFPSYADLPAFCSAVGNMTILHWLIARATYYGLEDTAQSVDCESLLLRVNNVFAEVGDVAQETRVAIADNKIDHAEIRHLIRELTDVVDCGMALIGDLRRMGGKQNA